MTLLAALVATSRRVQATRSRSAKVAALAEFLAAIDPDEVELAVAFLAGQTRQGRVGVGWATVGRVSVEAAEEATLSIADLDAAVTDLQGLGGAGSNEARRARLEKLLGAATMDEADFMRRLLLGEIRQGALEGIMADAVAKAAAVPAAAVRRAAMLAGDLPRVACVALTEGEQGLAGVGLEPLRPVQPMLASTAADVAEAVAACAMSSVEWKLDGARIQVHRSGAEIRLFTRNLNDVTNRLPGVVAAVRSLPVAQVVLDGEVIGVGDEERPDMFQETMSRFGRQSPDGGGADLGVWFFDCLHRDGLDLIDAPLIDRLAALAEIVGPLQVPGILTDDPGRAAAFLEEALAAGHEGVMVKDATSTYEAGRRGKSWRKVKPVRTLDLVVLAAEWGYGRRQGWLSNIHLGARDPAGGFVMVGKTFKGMTDAMLTWQTERFLELEQARQRHVVELRPELVVEVALDGVQVSSRYPGGVALRFARVRRYRDDKGAGEADTIDDVRRLLPGA